MGDESESAGEPSRDPDGSDEPTDRVTESTDTDTEPAAEPEVAETSDGDGDVDGDGADDVAVADNADDADDAAADADDADVANDADDADDDAAVDDADDDAAADVDDDADADDVDTDGATETSDSDTDDGATADGESDTGGLEPVDDADAADADTDADASDSASEESPSPDADTDDSSETSEADGGFSNEMPDGFAEDFSHLEDDGDDLDDFEDGFIDGPDSDQEMPLADHIEEMVRRLAVVFVLGGGVALSVFGLGEVLAYVPSTVDIINFLWNQHIPGAGLPGNEDLRPHVYGPLELILTKLKVAGLVGVVVGLPVFVYESYLFMRPGLYQNERKYYLASVPTSLILAVVGVAFAHFVVLPSIFAYFTSYTTGTALIAFGLAETFNLILILMGYMAIVFQIPLFIMLAIMMNLVTREWLEDKRLIFWGAFLGLAFLVSPDPTGMAPIIIAITMVTLFEGTLALLRWTGN
ncbi:sec-independent protein translocase protein TatC [Halogranum gelatinilyticum]|uniref:Sec-independent protein translocase protein TatC n=1 Tax=Halogranum gelatinilyticum TaxID=660521 RepID=A0A1G9PAK4_9EURY|nr:twin-arginine translocase subunit TatC [Halogranum gelatinilyticum]SDL95789.1 sec-independent protein translocase protein TatC [Halogranum gelatinilyticum]